MANRDRPNSDTQRPVDSLTAHKRLVEADTEARKDWQAMSREVQAQQNQLESDRRSLASQRQWDSLLASSFWGLGTLAVLKQLSLGTMPPEDEPRPDREGLENVVHWLRQTLKLPDGVTDIAVIRSSEVVQSESLRLGCCDLRSGRGRRIREASIDPEPGGHCLVVLRACSECWWKCCWCRWCWWWRWCRWGCWCAIN